MLSRADIVVHDQEKCEYLAPLSEYYQERGRKPLAKLIKERHKLRVDYPGLNETIEI
ncbi:MAG TPA: hypothetical protein VKD72_30735 [Gemmataceae bacterium]|nr:hypothetical protein [Gemmataceae bacterium]